MSDAPNISEPEPIEIMNDHLVGSTGRTHVVMLRPPILPMPYEEAIRMAAWIVLVTNGEERFAEISKAIRSTT